MKHKKSAVVFLLLAIALMIALTLSKGDLSSVTSTDELGQRLGTITLMPTILAIVLVFITKNILFSLLIGFISGVIIITTSYATSIYQTVPMFLNNVVDSIKNVALDIENIEVAILCLAIGGMVEIVRSSGGFDALAQKLTVRIDTPREAGITAGLLGLLIFFDDYANALIVGPIMKPIVDRVKVSREKLAYIVDSTCAPVAGISLVSSWIGVEISSIQTGLDAIGSNLDSFSLFINSIPYSFYCIFAISFVFIGSLLDRDFGPMLTAEKRAKALSEKTINNNETKLAKSNLRKRIFVSVGSVLLLVTFAVIAFYVTGKNNAVLAGALNINSSFNIENILIAISYADTINLISLAAILSSIFALIFGLVFKLFNFKDAISSFVQGMKSIFSTILLLFFAWCLADVIYKMGTTSFAVEIISANVPAVLVPLLIYITCCIISLTSGSFGTMFVVMPLAIPLATRLISMGVNIDASTYLYLCIGSVIAGSIFGDHCSPVTDCTILAATSTDCQTLDHCISQLPYATVSLIISIVCGIILTSIGVKVQLTILIGLMVQTVVLLVIGKKPI